MRKLNMTASTNKFTSNQDGKSAPVDLNTLWEENEKEATSHEGCTSHNKIDEEIELDTYNQQIPTPPKEELFLEPEELSDNIHTKEREAPTAINTNQINSEIPQDEETNVIGSHNKAGFAKKVIRTSSWRAFYIHFALICCFILLAQFPSIPLSMFSQQDFSTLPDNIASNLPNIIMFACYAVSLLLIILIFKQKQTGSLHIYSDYVVFKNAMFDKGTTIHFQDIRTIDIHSGFATLYADIGDFHLISQKDHIIIKNMYQPFLLKDKINQKKAHNQK